MNRKKDLFQLQTNPPGEILFQCTLHFVALMPALNCFGTCHKYWWNSCSLQNTFPFILLTFPSISLFFSRHASHLFPRSLLHSVWAAVWSCIWEIKSLVHYDFLATWHPWTTPALVHLLLACIIIIVRLKYKVLESWVILYIYSCRPHEFLKTYLLTHFLVW